jgi:hypothetical protein
VSQRISRAVDIFCQTASASSLIVYSEREGGGVVALPLISTLSEEGRAAALALRAASVPTAIVLKELRSHRMLRVGV